MKNIKPISVYKDGESIEATILDAYAVNVTLGQKATFYFALLDDKLNQINNGNLVMEGEDYQSWDQDAKAWDWIAGKLGVTISGDFKLVPSVSNNIIG